MELVSRRINNVWTEFPVYTRGEAEELGLDAVHWRKAQPGQWGITDDGYVMECKFRKRYTMESGCSNTYLRFTAGTKWMGHKKPFNFEEIHANKGYCQASGKTFREGQFARGVVKSVIHQAAVQRISRGIFDYVQLAKVFDHDGKLSFSLPQVKKILHSKKGKRLVRKEVERLLIGGGMTVADWIKLGERAFEKADEEDNVSEMRRIWEKWGEFLAIKESHMGEISPAAGHEVLDAISEDLKQLPAKGVTNGK